MVDVATAVAVDVVAVVSHSKLPLPSNSSLFHQTMGLTEPLVGHFSSSNAAPLGGGRRW